MLPLRPSNKWLVVAVSCCTAGCATADYQVLDSSGKVLQHVSANSPGGDSFVTVVYYGPNRTPIISAGGDSTALVDATARAGRAAVQLALKAAH